MSICCTAHVRARCTVHTVPRLNMQPFRGCWWRQVWRWRWRVQGGWRVWRGWRRLQVNGRWRWCPRWQVLQVRPAGCVLKKAGLLAVHACTDCGSVGGHQVIWDMLWSCHMPTAALRALKQCESTSPTAKYTASNAIIFCPRVAAACRPLQQRVPQLPHLTAAGGAVHWCTGAGHLDNTRGTAIRS